MTSKNYLITCVCICLVLFTSLSSYAQKEQHILYAKDVKRNTKTTSLITDDQLATKVGVSNNGNVNGEPDLVFTVDIRKPGKFLFHSLAYTDAEGKKIMSKAKTKFESLFMTIQIDDQKKTKRVVYVPWDVPRQELGKFDLTPQSKVKIWLPKGVILEYLQVDTYVPPAIPQAAKDYTPSLVPPVGHPRLFVTEETLPQVKANLQLGENAARWNTVKDLALKPFAITFNESEEVSFNEDLEKAVEAKAFYYLVTKDTNIGKEAIHLTRNYLSLVEFGNLLDITRETGRTIHIASEVFDWCNDLLTKEDKKLFHKHLLRLAQDMEIGWPPFLQSIINGHGNEAQVCRDLLSMSIALYDEDPTLYQYCAYMILEELVPMRKFEYQSPRHNQGINYGVYRFNWDLHAAWIFKRMLNQEVFDPNIKNMGEYWLYSRTPDGQMLRDGDQSLQGKPDEFFFWQINPTSFFMNYSYSQNPYIKHDFERMTNNNTVNPVLFLLLNDPSFKSKEIPQDYPLTKDFGPVLGAMTNRTGWGLDINSNHVVAEIKGGGYQFANHQHPDAGSLQIYHRGLQVADLGLYKFYGTPYDMNFTKRSVSHSMMLSIDPNEKFVNYPANDGGARMNRKFPTTPEQTMSEPEFKSGIILSSAFGPDKIKPVFNYFAMDLTSAYSEKIKSYVRDYIFINNESEDAPAMIILKDQMVTADPEFKKYWQINTLKQPKTKDGSIILQNTRNQNTSNTFVNFVYPNQDDLEIQILSGTETFNIFGYQVTPPLDDQAEAYGHRILVSPKQANASDNFLSVFYITNEGVTPASVSHTKVGQFDRIDVNNKTIFLRDGHDYNRANLTFELNIKEAREVFFAGLADGEWILSNEIGKVIKNYNVSKKKNTIIENLPKGKYTLSLKK